MPRIVVPLRCALSVRYPSALANEPRSRQMSTKASLTDKSQYIPRNY